MGVVSAPVSNSVVGGPSPSAEWPCPDIRNSLHLSLFCVCVCYAVDYESDIHSHTVVTVHFNPTIYGVREVNVTLSLDRGISTSFTVIIQPGLRLKCACVVYKYTYSLFTDYM